jgi:dipeptidyl aminopeptidase/acylaminoacyl peptidase
MVSFLRVDSVAQIISATIFFPLFAYFAQLVTPTREQHGDDELLEDLQEIRAEQAAIQRIDQSATPSVLPDNAHVLSPVQLHHGLADETVPYSLSQKYYDVLKDKGKTVEAFYYENNDHNISQSFNLAMERSVDFFDKYLK